MEEIIERYENPLRYTKEVKDLIIEVSEKMLESGPHVWIGEKGKTPVSLEIPWEITEEISAICREREIVQWNFETKLYTHLVLEGLMLTFLIRKSKVFRDSLDALKKEADEMIKEEYHNGATRTDT